MSTLNSYFDQTKRTNASQQQSGKTTKQAKGQVKQQVMENPEDSYLQEQMHRQLFDFDQDQTYGPCKGISRMQRWTKAYNLGLYPPQSIPDLIKQTGIDQSYLEQYLI
eukprot:403374863